MNADDFLKMEYPQSIDLIKFYDTRQNELVKFASGLAAAVPTAILGFRAVAETSAHAVKDFTAVAAILTGLSLLVIFAALVQNRLYFVYPARQANAIRANMYSALAGLPQNQMYVKSDFPVFVGASSQTLQLAFVALQVGSFFGIAAWARWGGTQKACLIGAGVAAGLLIAATTYLSSMDRKSADEAVHG